MPTSCSNSSSAGPDELASRVVDMLASRGMIAQEGTDQA